MMRLTVLVFGALLWAHSTARGQSVSPAGLRAADSILTSWTGAERIPGAVLLVIQGGRVVFDRAYGVRHLFTIDSGEYGLSAAGRSSPTALRRLPDPDPMTRKTVFDLASVTKVMATTFAAMLLVDRGQVELDAPVATYLPDFIGGGREDVTVRHLLTHRAGLRQWVPVYYHATNAAEAYAHIRDLPLAWPPGDERHYSDLGFMVLGRLVEEVAGERLDVFLEEELYRPLGLEATGFRGLGTVGSHVFAGGPWAATSHGNPYENRMVHDTTFGYHIAGDPDAWNGWRHRTLIGEVNDGNAFHAFRGVAGHAGLFSTARDLGVLLQLLLDDGRSRGTPVVATTTVRTFLTPASEGQALGWQAPEWAPEGSFAHTGFTGTFVLGVPSRALAVVLLTNRQNVGLDADGLYPDVGPLQRSVARALLGGGDP